MKPSSLKQLLKSCKDGVTLTVQRQPGINLSSFSSTSIPRPRKTSLGSRSQRDIIGHDSLPLQNGGKPMQPQRLSSELVPSPGTPKSTISESSAGYHSLTHSMPSELSNNNIMPVKPFGLDSRTGHASPEQEQIHFENRRPRYLSDSSSASCEPTSPHYKMRSMSSNVVSGLNRSSYRNRPADYYPPRRHTSTATTYSSPFPKSATGERHIEHLFQPLNLHTQVFYTEVSSFQGVEIEGLHCIQKVSSFQGVGIQKLYTEVSLFHWV